MKPANPTLGDIAVRDFAYVTLCRRMVFPNKLSLSRFTGVLEGGQSGSQAVGLGPQIRSPRGGRHRNGPPYRVMAMVIVMEW